MDPTVAECTKQAVAWPSRWHVGPCQKNHAANACRCCWFRTVSVPGLYTYYVDLCSLPIFHISTGTGHDQCSDQPRRSAISDCSLVIQPVSNGRSVHISSYPDACQRQGSAFKYYRRFNLYPQNIDAESRMIRLHSLHYRLKCPE